MHKLFTLLPLLGVVSCTAMQRESSVCTADPLLWADQLHASIAPTPEDVRSCIRALERAMPLDQLNDLELQAHQYQEGGEKFKELEFMKHKCTQHPFLVGQLDAFDEFFRELHDPLSQRLTHINTPSDNSSTGNIEHIEHDDKEKVLLMEMVRILTYHIYGTNKQAEEQRHEDYQRLRNLIFSLLQEVSVKYASITSTPHTKRTPLFSDSSEEEELLLPGSPADSLHKTQETPVEDLTNEALGPEFLDELEKTVEDLDSFASPAQGKLPLDESMSPSSSDMLPIEEHKEEFLTVSSHLLDHIEKSTIEPLTDEQHKLLDYVSLIKRVAYLTKLLELNESYKQQEEADNKRNIERLQILEEKKKRTLQELSDLKASIERYKEKIAALRILNT